MNPIIKNILAVIAGIIFGSLVNMGIIILGGQVVSPPAGADTTTMEGLRESMHLMEPVHFLFPFLAHALGTFAGAFLAATIAASHKMKFALGVGVYFLLGGIYMVYLLPAPTWFAVTDLVLAYIPVSYLAGKMAWGQVKEKSFT